MYVSTDVELDSIVVDIIDDLHDSSYLDLHDTTDMVLIYKYCDDKLHKLLVDYYIIHFILVSEYVDWLVVIWKILVFQGMKQRCWIYKSILLSLMDLKPLAKMKISVTIYVWIKEWDTLFCLPQESNT